MNQEAYASQVYNVGSPYPTARRNLADSFPLNKSLSSGSKQKFSPDKDTETQRAKMVRVGDMEMDDLVKALQGAFKSQFEEVKEDIRKVR